MLESERLRRGLATLEIDLSPAAQETLLKYLDELERWNRRINLTAIRDRSEGVEKHLIDSLTPLPLLKEGEALIDIGSGPGLPGIALKIARPSLKVVSVESIGKKASFQRHIVRTLHLGGFEVCAERAQTLCQRESMRGRFDLAISRAFSALGDFAALALPFLSPEGRLLAMKGVQGEVEIEREAPVLQRLGLEVRELRRLRLPFSGAERTLIVLGRAGTGEKEEV